jgi:cellulose synthase/poly-beta-1,6-N-acetylglucosamine synthase-like glycosyltransferase
MFEVCFWITCSLLVYTFIGYPLLLKVIAAIAPKRQAAAGCFLPAVSVILSVYNEEKVIREKIENFLAIDYPAELLELVIVSDLCTDRTEDCICAFNNPRIKLLRNQQRSGKTLNLNRAVTVANGEILVFTDANSMFAADAVQRLTAHFADSRVGLVSGRSVYLDANNRNEQLGGAYRRYEETIKEAESAVTSIVGADGAIYALRASLYEPLRSEQINDFIHTIQTVIKGYAAISDQKAICTEVVEECYAQELHRQTRIMAQSWLIYLSQAGKLLAAGKLLYFWALTSHKLLRWLTIPLLLILIAANSLLLSSGLLYQCLFAGQLLFIMLALLGIKLKSGLPRVPYMFLLLHIAAVLGLCKYLTGNFYTTWSPREN